MNSSTAQAQDYLTGAILRAREQRATHLPAHRTMAAAAGVAPATMLKAIRHCCNQGVLSADRRGVKVLSAPESNSPPLGAPNQRWRQIHDRLRTQIAQGAFAPEQILPTPKELTHLHGVAYRTLKKALDQLVGSGIIEPHRRAYRVRSVVTKNLLFAPTIIVMMRGEPYLAPALTSPRTVPQLRLLEEQCNLRGIRLELCLWHYEQTTLRGNERLRSALDHRSEEKNIVGCMLWSTAVEPTVVLDAARIVRDANKPLAIFDEEGNLDLSKLRGNKRSIIYLRLPHGTESGRQVARFLWELGHRDFAFIDFEEYRDFGFTRFAGIREELDHIGQARLQCYKIAPSHSFAIAHPGYQQLRQRIFGDNPSFAFETQPLRDRLAEAAIFQVDEALHRQPERNILWQRLDTVVQSGATAWIGCNDIIALDCLDFLELHSIAVPQAISVIGFDDGLEAMLRQMSSYNFNAQSWISAGLDFILGKEPTSGVAGQQGYIVQRRSTAPPC